ncbi:MAG TPA: polyphosphate kinase 1, partial [Lachnospiraceae bacterium]|nr:polyphosphate kinase 1 [Lachnospiraceae bacterium]
MAESVNFRNPQYYINRELSWLEFDRRCLSEARNKENPLFERLKFLSITASNLDEFFMVRVASLQDMVQAGYRKKDIAGMTAQEQLSAVLKEAHSFLQQQYWTLNRQLIPALEEQGLFMVRDLDTLSKAEVRYLEDYFSSTVFPVLTPMAVDSSRPFPLIRNKSLNIGALLTRRETEKPGILGASKKPKKGGKTAKVKYEFATVQVPAVLPRILLLPAGEGEPRRLVLLEDLIRKYLPKLFVNYEVKCMAPYRIMRSADFDLAEDEAEDLLEEIKKQLKKRQRGDAIRLEVEKGTDPQLLKLLMTELSLEKDFVFEIDGPLDLTYLMKAYGIEGFEELREHRYDKPQPVPELMPGCDIFEQIRKGDIFMHHPYQTFDPVVRFVATAAADPDVLAIKQTLYRVSGNSPIIAALARAAENGKQVTVLVELKARFDEENNIVWAKELEKAGCHVIYGLQNLKTH